MAKIDFFLWFLVSRNITGFLCPLRNNSKSVTTATVTVQAGFDWIRIIELPMGWQFHSGIGTEKGADCFQTGEGGREAGLASAVSVSTPQGEVGSTTTLHPNVFCPGQASGRNAQGSLGRAGCATNFGQLRTPSPSLLGNECQDNCIRS